MNPPGSVILPEMEPDSREWDMISRMWKFFFFLIIFQTIIFVHMYGNIGHLLLEGN